MFILWVDYRKTLSIIFINVTDLVGIFSDRMQSIRFVVLLIDLMLIVLINSYNLCIFYWLGYLFAE